MSGNRSFQITIQRINQNAVLIVREHKPVDSASASPNLERSFTGINSHLCSHIASIQVAELYEDAVLFILDSGKHK